MRRYVNEFLVVTFLYCLVVGLTNYYIDVANIFNDWTVMEMASALNRGVMVRSYGDEDEGMRHELVISELKTKLDILIAGSSHSAYIPFENNMSSMGFYYNASVSGAYLGDIYGEIGLLDYYGNLPTKIIICIDQKMFRHDIDTMYFSSLNNYKDYENEIVKGKDASIISRIRNSSCLKKITELFAPSYFQSSIKNWRTGRTKEKDLYIENTDEIGNYVKIRPNGSRVLGENTHCTVDKIIEDTEYYIYIDPRQESWVIEDAYMERPNADTKAAMCAFENLLDSLIERGIEIELYLPTWNPIMYEYCKNSEYSGGLEVEEYIREIAVNRGIVVRGSYNPDETGISIDDFWDWQHMAPESMLSTFEYIRGEEN